MSSIHPQHNNSGTTWRVLWREDGRQRSLTFGDEKSAERFKRNLDTHGPSEALRVVEVEEAEHRVPTVKEWLLEHIDSLTGVQPATLARYRTYCHSDVTFGDLPLTAVTEHTIAKWVQGLEQGGDSGKTVQNKHGMLSGAFKAAVRAGHIKGNP